MVCYLSELILSFQIPVLSFRSLPLGENATATPLRDIGDGDERSIDDHRVRLVCCIHRVIPRIIVEYASDRVFP
jgi:hypothetical protein